MKKSLIAIAIAAATLSTVAVAGQTDQWIGCNKDPQQMTECKITRMTDRLGLTTEQQDQFREILTARQAEKQARLDTFRDQVFAVLNDQQKEELQASMDLRGQSRENRGETDVARFVERRIRHLSETLDLSETQQTDIAEVLTEEQVNILDELR